MLAFAEQTLLLIYLLPVLGLVLGAMPAVVVWQAYKKGWAWRGRSLTRPRLSPAYRCRDSGFGVR
ncbi:MULTISPECIES: hypothetical protein [Alishewanella]|uniref:Uncharacterized protein n=2 Tax=Alishewanella TaxID=111142 RepID=H3ZGT7_9ALTE|nr:MULTISPECIES: hypothetical protein [Alishewanella]EHR40213.1 hypothetical protein AJE_12935 [Alishewanella jeotgali KCTC 22429]EJI86427.1 hypothetical protein AEST_07430 [Alishewanella aestuarii B11]